MGRIPMDRIKRKKIVLIGPVYPYKGGIAHYSALMYRALSQKYDVQLISYKMQYPKILFHREQKDYANDMFQIKKAQFLINTANPCNIVRTAYQLRKMRPDLVIIQWWHPYFAPCYRIMEAVLGKTVKKLFVCHNVFPHERFWGDKYLTKAVLQKADFFLLHSRSEIADLLTIKPDARYIHNPHPTYNAFQIRHLTKAQACRELLFDEREKILLFFGFVREYKGLKHLIAAMPDVKRQLGGVRLVIAGSFGSDREEYLQLIEKKQVGDCVRLVDGYIPDNAVECYFAACDIVVLPYESATQSGIVQIAFGFGKPVIVTDAGGLPDVVENGQTGYIVERGNVRQLSDAIVRYFQCNKEAAFAGNVRKEAYRFSWDRMVEKIDMLVGGQEDGQTIN